MALGAFAVLTILLIVAAIPLSIIIFSRNYSTKKQSVEIVGGGWWGKFSAWGIELGQRVYL